MSQILINGPIVPKGVHNVVLKECLLFSPVSRALSQESYQVVEIGVSEGAYTTWVGKWSQDTQLVEAATPLGILDTGREGMRLRSGQALVARVTTNGTPDSLRGSRLNFRLGRVGGRDGPAGPLVASAGAVRDTSSRTALAALERQINSGGLSEWTEPLQLRDPVELVVTSSFQGRLQVDSSTQVSLQRYTGNWVEVNGQAISLGADGLIATSSDGLLQATGDVSSSTCSAGNLYHAYVGFAAREPQLRLSGTTPTRHLGTYYLGASGNARLWRFVGWVYYTTDPAFRDTVTDRLYANYYNRVLVDLFRTPGYVDDDATTTYTEVSTNWIQMNAGTGSQVRFVSNGEDAAVLHATGTVYNSSAANTTYVGIGVDSATAAARGSGHQGTLIGNVAVHYSDVLSAGLHTGDILVRASAGTSTIIADQERFGSTADVPMSYISGQVLV